jgi:hypothetical protein
MPKLSRAKNGDWFARKVIPPDVRDAYQRAYGVRQEERFRLTTDKSAGEAKAAFAQWVADIEGRIAALRSAASGAALELSHRELHDLAGRWYDWFIDQYQDSDATVEVWDHHYERYQDALSRFNSAHEEDEPDDDAQRPPLVTAYMRATVLELSRLPTFLADEGIALSPVSHAALVDTIERDLLAAMALLRRRAGGDYRPDKHRERFPKAAPVNPANVKLSGWNAWEAFEAWVGPRTSAHLKLAVRWVPWLCAYTGARSGEMTQLRKQDIERHKDGFWLVHITPDAGTVKGSMPRTVVLHERCLDLEHGSIWDFVAVNNMEDR